MERATQWVAQRITRWVATAASERGMPILVITMVALGSTNMLGGSAQDGAVAAVVLMAALVSSIAGFAFAALAGSALAYLRFDPVEAVMTMALCSIAMQSYAVWQLRDRIRWRALAPMLAAGAVTTPLGVALLIHIDAKAYAAVIGALVACYGGYVLLRRRVPVIRAAAGYDALVGAIGGVIGGLSSAPGLVVTVWCSMRDGDKDRQRAMYQPFILAMQLVTVACLVSTSALHGEPWRNASLVPFALLGAVGGYALYRRLSQRQFHAALSLMLIVSGVGLLARAY